jgi:hypothetical protein
MPDNPGISAKRAAAGRLGGLSLKRKYGDSFFSVIGRKGGRPRSKTLKELNLQRELRRKELKQRRVASTADVISLLSIRELSEQLKIKIELGELAPCGDGSSPKGGQ